VSPMHGSSMEGRRKVAKLVVPSAGETCGREWYWLVIFCNASAGDKTTAAHSSTIPTALLLKVFLSSWFHCTLSLKL
jgi:hypothetical protein